MWIYDLRSGMPNFGKRSPFTREQLAGFEAAYGADPRGRSAGIPRFRRRCI